MPPSLSQDPHDDALTEGLLQSQQSGRRKSSQANQGQTIDGFMNVQRRTYPNRLRIVLAGFKLSLIFAFVHFGQHFQIYAPLCFRCNFSFCISAQTAKNKKEMASASRPPSVTTLGLVRLSSLCTVGLRTHLSLGSPPAPESLYLRLLFPGSGSPSPCLPLSGSVAVPAEASLAGEP